MRSRLFLKVYATLLMTLAVVAVASFMFVRMGQDEQDRGWASRRDHFLAAMLPSDADPAALGIVLDRLAAAFDGDIAVFGPDGSPIAAAGRMLPPELLERVHDQRPGGGPHGFVARLPDGRYVAARIDLPFGPGHGNALRYLALVAAVTGLAAYPVVRHLTRRLESLRRGVEAWGAGALDRRVAVEGKDEVAAVARTFNQAADRIERLVAAHRSLLANASHELRSPLARLRMAIDLYEQSASDERKSEIVRNLGELDGLVEEILLASRLDHGGRLEAAEAVDLLALTAEEGARNGVIGQRRAGDRARRPQAVDSPGAQSDAERAAPRRAAGDGRARARRRHGRASHPRPWAGHPGRRGRAGVRAVLPPVGTRRDRRRLGARPVAGAPDRQAPQGVGAHRDAGRRRRLLRRGVSEGGLRRLPTMVR